MALDAPALQHGPTRFYGYANQADPYVSLMNMTGLPDELLPVGMAEDVEFQARWAIGELLLSKHGVHTMHDIEFAYLFSDADRHSYYVWLGRYAQRLCGWKELFCDDEYFNSMEAHVPPQMFVTDRIRPADLVEPDGTQRWMLAGVEHRDNDLPAVIRPDGTKEWRWKGVLDRPFGVDELDESTQLPTVERHPLVGPTEYHVAGSLHRTAGPAIEHALNPTLDQYWVEGRRLSYERWWPLSDECRAAEDHADRFC